MSTREVTCAADKPAAPVAPLLHRSNARVENSVLIKKKHTYTLQSKNKTLSPDGATKACKNVYY